MIHNLKLIFISVSLLSVNALQIKYHSNNEIEAVLKNFARNITNLQTHVYSIGQTLAGNQLWVLNITGNTKKKLGVPNIKLIGNIHGNEAIGREVLLHFIQYLSDNYDKNSQVKWLLDNTKIHILPSVNPDGFAIIKIPKCTGNHGRYIGNTNIDLNRNFPGYFHVNTAPVAVETKSVMQWMDEIPFVLSAALHSGALVANYPFDTIKEKMTGQNLPSYTPDNDVFKHLATVYANEHPTMHQGNSCTPTFEGGIVNGAQWYIFSGGMGDYNYAMRDCMELTLEISCCKYPEEKHLQNVINENLKPLLKYCEQALNGVSGVVFDAITNQRIPNANLTVIGRDKIFTSSKNGEFWRLLLPGKYKLQVEAAGYYTGVRKFVVKSYESKPKLTFLYVSLLNSSYSTTSMQEITSTTSSTTPVTTQLFQNVTDGNLKTTDNCDTKIVFFALTSHGILIKADLFQLLFILISFLLYK